MARYRITYLNSHNEIIEAADINYDPDRIQYIATASDGTVTAYIPIGNVLSIVVVSQTADAYPRNDGDVTVLGPEVFASNDGETISWKGEHYTRRFYPLGRQVTG